MRVPKADTLLGDVLIQGEDRCHTAGVETESVWKKQANAGLPTKGRGLAGVAKAATLWSRRAPEPSVPSV